MEHFKTEDELDDLRASMYQGVLYALDEWAKTELPENKYVQGNETPGATDADLDSLFRALDDHFARLVQRYGLRP